MVSIAGRDVKAGISEVHFLQQWKDGVTWVTDKEPEALTGFDCGE